MIREAGDTAVNADESGTIRIGDDRQSRTFVAGVYGTQTNIEATPVYVDSAGQLVTGSSAGTPSAGGPVLRDSIGKSVGVVVTAGTMPFAATAASLALASVNGRSFLIQYTMDGFIQLNSQPTYDTPDCTGPELVKWETSMGMYYAPFSSQTKIARVSSVAPFYRGATYQGTPGNCSSNGQPGYYSPLDDSVDMSTFSMPLVAK